jgi:hypothetical protein
LDVPFSAEDSDRSAADLESTFVADALIVFELGWRLPSNLALNWVVACTVDWGVTSFAARRPVNDFCCEERETALSARLSVRRSAVALEAI